MPLKDKVNNIDIQKVHAMEILRGKELESEKYLKQELNMKLQVQESQFNNVLTISAHEH